MSRYVIQSATTGAFLAPDPSTGFGEPAWVMLLDEAGVLDDLESCAELIEDHCEPFHRAKAIDLHAL
ncbi:hypothetical protein N7340_17810 [Comamonas aquatica]|uniref:hypothetical protein n=1 Tax=Comamonas aquatica TaxID=225991 RepID=UPI002448E7A7|nr:hypothetical protein [Comamonas aquatica]MDH0373597.1 hypothetical protein [Comamonas aquatica]